MLQALPKSSADRPRGPRSSARWLRGSMGLLALLGVAGYLLFHYLTGPSPEGCTVRIGEQRVELDVTQAANAATITAVASVRGLPERAVTIALATAMQESGLENIRYGDRDSLGLFQQRPSQGWGTREQVLDPVYSSNAFFEALEDVPGYSRLPLTVAAQKVQRSGYPQAYAKHEPEAAVVAAALTGREGGALTCTINADSEPGGSAGRVADRVEREFVDVAGSVERSGRTLRYRPEADGVEGGRHGWALAQWAITHAKELKIERVAYADREWSADKSDDGWRGGGNGSADHSTDRVLITVSKK
nr:hypothetical protein [Wenjunlia vitaminophila]